MPIIVTGFDAFAAHPTNPSGLVVERLQGRSSLIKAILPTSYARAGEQLNSLLQRHAPSAVLLLGLSARATGLVLERRARNRDDSHALDNDGVRRLDLRIEEKGPDSYPATLPLERFARLADEQGLRSSYSDDAGGFLCNHVFYRAAHFIASRQSKALCGFVHVPPAEGLELEQIRSCVQRFIGVLDET